MDFFDRFQLINMSIFYFIFIGRIIQMTLSGTNPIVLGSGKRGFKALFEIFLLIGFVIWTFEALSICLGLKYHLFRDPLLFSIIHLRISGVILEVAGLIIFVSAIFSFGRSWRLGIDTKGPDELVTKGVFSLTRNPIFLSLDLFFFGTFLIYPTIFFAVSAVFVILGSHFQIIQEEKFLENEYGERYLEYKKQVRRYL